MVSVSQPLFQVDGVLQIGEIISVAEWFHNFCLVCNNAGVLPEAAERVAATGPRKRHIRPSRKVLQRVSTSSMN